ncbi:MAG: RdgB/HAM1 family non-canonical purine NTP pyrophosphatase [Ferruginibacter sp.]
MKTLVFATNNLNKVEEIKAVLHDSFKLVSLEEAGIDIDIPEPHHTLEENAGEKSQTIYKLTGKDCFSEDSGLEVKELQGEPGVRSARYAGDNAGPEENISKLLFNLKNKSGREAKFRTVISLILHGKEYLFEGICKGKITDHPSGKSGFGYDPVFIPDGASITFAEMSMDEKNNYSHRKKAVEKLIAFLNSYNEQE